MSDKNAAAIGAPSRRLFSDFIIAAGGAPADSRTTPDALQRPRFHERKAPFGNNSLVDCFTSCHPGELLLN